MKDENGDEYVICPACKGRIYNGNTIRWDKETKVVYHSGCYPKELKDKKDEIR